MIKYRFITDWSFKTSAEKVWALAKEPETIMGWWPEIKEINIIGENKDIVKGSMIEVVVRGIPCQFKFNLEVTGIDPERELCLRSTGDLEGYGILTLAEEGNLTKTKFVWEIGTTSWWANVIGFFLKPLLIWSHNRAMRSGYKAIKNRIEQRSKKRAG